MAIRTRTNTITHPEPKDEHESHIVRKWGVTGKASFSGNGRCCTITVESWKGKANVLFHTLRHEMGHVEFFEDRLEDNPNIPFKDLMDVNTWQAEVDAWLRGLPVPFPLQTGMFALDCLWTYKVACGIKRDEWMKAKIAIAESCEDPKALMDYTPEPVPPGEASAEPSFDMDGQEFDENGEDLPDQDVPQGKYDEDDKLPDENGMSERDKWLCSEEALPILKVGSSYKLMEALRERGFPTAGPLPMVPAAVFKKAGGNWDLWGGER